MKTRFLKSIIALAVALPMSLSAQTDVNRAKYPDYSDKTNPDWSLMPKQGANKAQRADGATKAQRPAYVNNANEKFFPPVFNQDGGSCGSASRICYMFTYLYYIKHHRVMKTTHSHCIRKLRWRF